jgi:hypothetical protein
VYLLPLKVNKESKVCQEKEGIGVILVLRECKDRKVHKDYLVDHKDSRVSRDNKVFKEIHKVRKVTKAHQVQKEPGVHRVHKVILEIEALKVIRA